MNRTAGSMKRLYSVLTDDLEHCIVTGSCNVAIHHVFNGANRKLSEKYGFLVPLRPDWHNMTPYSVHMDQREPGRFPEGVWKIIFMTGKQKGKLWILD